MEPMDHQEETVMIGVKTIKQKEQEKCTTVRRKLQFSCSDYCMKWTNNTVSGGFQLLSGLGRAP